MGRWFLNAYVLANEDLNPRQIPPNENYWINSRSEFANTALFYTIATIEGDCDALTVESVVSG